MYHTKSKSRSYLGSFKEEERRKWNSRFVLSVADLKLSLGDDAVDELEKISHIEARMLERGTGKLRKCRECNDVYVNPNKTEAKYVGLINRRGYICRYCNTGKREVMRNVHNERFEKRREIMQKVWDLYQSRLHEGVIVRKATQEELGKKQ